MLLDNPSTEIIDHESVYAVAKKLIRQKHTMYIGLQKLIMRLQLDGPVHKKDLMEIIIETLEKSEG